MRAPTGEDLLAVALTPLYVATAVTTLAWHLALSPLWTPIQRN